MKILIKQIKIIDPASPHHLQTVDILIERGIISSIQSSISLQADKIITEANLCISGGWVDVFAHFADPGYEAKETAETGAMAAANGGYTDVFIVPNTNPCIDNKVQIQYLTHKTENIAVTIYPIGAISVQTKGAELAELYDMKKHGAIAFSDGLKPVQNANFLLKALQYVKTDNSLIIQMPCDNQISPNGAMNEGIISTRLGLPGKPALAEELMVRRDIELCKYTNSHLHITGISSKESVEIIKEAKQNGIQVTCSVTPYHLLFTENDLDNYNTQLKVNPVIRTDADREALRNAILDGTIDCIASHHCPQDDDNKIIDFENAAFGMATLDTVFSMLVAAMPQVKAEKWVELLAQNPRKIFGLTQPVICENEVAHCTLFSTEGHTTYNAENYFSISKNNPFYNKTLPGKVWGVIQPGKINLRKL